MTSTIRPRRSASRARRSPLALALVLAAVAGCGSDDDGPSGGAAGDIGDGRLPPIDGSEQTDPVDIVIGLPDAAGGYVTAPGVEACSVADLNARVDFDMRDYYVYAERVASVSPADFDSPEGLIAELRVEPDIFSSVSDYEAFQAQSEGRQSGFGFVLLEDDAGVPRFRTVIGGSPAEAAGLVRGDELIALDGRNVEDLGAQGIVSDLREADEGQRITFTVRAPDEEPRDVDVVRAAYTIDTLAGTSVLDVDGRRIAYLPILQFAETTADALDARFAELVDEDVDALVLDVRYNPGGLIFAANRLAVHIAGDNVTNALDAAFVRYLHNERYARASNVDVPFERVDSTLNLDELVVITTEGSASSSELAINGLRPYIDVRTVGETTFGKAFGSRPLRYCDKAINAMLFETANANGETVAGGIPADCAVADEFRYPLADVRDALTGAALQLATGGTCPSDAQAAAPATRVRARDTVLWSELPEVPLALDR